MPFTNHGGIMGKGDKRSRRGKIISKSYGRKRPRKRNRRKSTRS